MSKSHHRLPGPTSRRLPVAQPILEPHDVIEILHQSVCIDRTMEPTVAVLMCDAAAELLTLLVVNHAPVDSNVTDTLADPLIRSLRTSDVAYIVVALIGPDSDRLPGGGDIGEWAPLAMRLGSYGIEIPDVLLITPTWWSSLALDHGEPDIDQWYGNGEGLIELLCHLSTG
jgi:hypothetical protein